MKNNKKSESEESKISQTRQIMPYKVSQSHNSKTHVNRIVTIELKP
jgi:hypothetical protein